VYSLYSRHLRVSFGQSRGRVETGHSGFENVPFPDISQIAHHVCPLPSQNLLDCSTHSPHQRRFCKNLLTLQRKRMSTLLRKQYLTIGLTTLISGPHSCPAFENFGPPLLH